MPSTLKCSTPIDSAKNGGRIEPIGALQDLLCRFLFQAFMREIGEHPQAPQSPKSFQIGHLRVLDGLQRYTEGLGGTGPLSLCTRVNSSPVTHKLQF